MKQTYQPRKEMEFRLYVLWKNLPRDISSTLWEKLGVADDEIIELSQLKTQGDFAAHFKVSPDTLTDWNKQINQGLLDPELEQLNWRYWAKQATSSVVSALLRELQKTGDASRFTAWMKYVEQAEEKSTLNVEWSGLADLVKKADEVLEEHGETIE